MANIDDILSDLGVGSEDAPKRAPRKPRLDQKNADRHTLDRRAGSFSPLPSMPSSQTRYGGDDTPSVDEDPAVLQKRAAAPQVDISKAVSEVYSPEAVGESGEISTQLSEMLIEQGGVSAEQVTNAEKIIAQTPGKSLVEVLLDQGADEEAVLSVVARSAGVAFERIDLEKGLDGGFDGKLLQRLTLEFCQSNQVVPLRTEGSRVVVGTLNPSDVFTTD
ncbi:MAG TPA: hypothetical protein EYO33_00800, partial [Phycisphaerales bacterium]|nr:hypothetical protein [Phycisphaerales bacterium]